jgi:hypothetical protein
MKTEKDHAKFFIPVKEGIQCYLKINPNSFTNKIDSLLEGEYGHKILRISVTALPEQGKANIMVIELLAKQWKLKKSQIKVKKGKSSRDKLIHISGDPKVLLQHLQKYSPEYIVR